MRVKEVNEMAAAKAVWYFGVARKCYNPARGVIPREYLESLGDWRPKSEVLVLLRSKKHPQRKAVLVNLELETWWGNGCSTSTRRNFIVTGPGVEDLGKRPGD